MRIKKLINIAITGYNKALQFFAFLLRKVYLRSKKVQAKSRFY